MRTLQPRSFLLAGLAAALPLLAAGGCKWTDFDDLKEETWVTSTRKPTREPYSLSANYAVALARVNRAGPGATLAVLGANQPLYSEIRIGPDGDVVFDDDSAQNLTTEFSLVNVALEPLFLSRPDMDEVAFVTGFEATRTLAIRSFGGQRVRVDDTGPGRPGGATYMMSPPRAGGDTVPTMQILVGQNEYVYGGYFDPSKAPPITNPPSRCLLHDEMARPINIRALAAYRPTTGAMSDDVLALTDTGRLLAYPGTVFHGCNEIPQPPKPGLFTMASATPFPGTQPGSQILVVSDGDPTYVVVQLHSDSGAGRLALYRIDADSIDEVGAARTIDRLRSAALFQPYSDSKRYVVVGMPTASVDGVEAGQVQAIELDTATGISSGPPALTLFDLKPEPNQAFGRGVAAVPFNGRSIIAVAADNDVFLYFQTTMYDDTREGR